MLSKAPLYEIAQANDNATIPAAERADFAAAMKIAAGEERAQLYIMQRDASVNAQLLGENYLVPPQSVR